MTGLRPENDLEVTMRSVRSGELPSERLAPALLEAELVVLVVGSPDPTTFQPLVVHRNDENFLAVFTATDQVPAAPSTRYFVREQMVDGQVVPVSVFRRRSSPEGPVDERLLDVDSWTDDRHGTVDKTIRFSLDADIEEISPEAAQDVFHMVARRSYVPLRRRRPPLPHRRGTRFT